MARDGQNSKKPVTSRSQVVQVPIECTFAVAPAAWNPQTLRLVETMAERNKRESAKYKGGRIKVPESISLREEGERDYVVLAAIRPGDHCGEEFFCDRSILPSKAIGATFEAVIGKSTKFKQTTDPWDMRAEFLRAASSVSLVKFLEKWGTWRGNLIPLGKGQPERLGEERTQQAVLVHELEVAQDKYRRGMFSSPGEWIGGDQGHTFNWLKPRLEFPYFAAQFTDCAQCIEGSLTLDKLRGVQFERCARKDCSNGFERKTRHPKRFCSAACQHLETVRKQRGQAD